MRAWEVDPTGKWTRPCIAPVANHFVSSLLLYGMRVQLYFCEFCLKFFRFKTELRHHAGKCTWRHPPGDEIYRGKDGIGMWEIDGIKEKQYCQVCVCVCVRAHARGGPVNLLTVYRGWDA
ncbi:MAG: hypothetical protein EOO65_01095 [Methanosarcinales archaeon]|nr:MAG: hypothetical protein EOO65_01095 [Methanosarcinales archaeon]